jgi:dienelactone hydrolase
MKHNPKVSRRAMLAGGASALTGASLASPAPVKADALAQEIPWPERRQRIERGWLDLLGDFPAEVPRLNPVQHRVTLEDGCPSGRLTREQLEVLKQQMADEGDGITRYHVSFQTQPNDRVTGWLLVPDSARRQATPAMICIHSTTRGSGKDQTIGLSGRTPADPPDTTEGGRSYGLHLARYGYVTLSIDLLTDGERIEPGANVLDSRPFYERHPEWSIVGKNTWDIMRSVDFLQTLDFVDPQHIGCVGLSLGGHTAVFAGAFEPRIAATISVGGVLDWHRPGEHWSRSRGTYIYIKKFRPYIDNPDLPVPVDFDELMMMVAPRPMLILSSEWEFYNRRNLLEKCLSVARMYLDWNDAEGLPSVIASRQARRSYEKTLSYYKERSDISPELMETQLRRIGAGDCFGWFSYPGGHSYPPVAKAIQLCVVGSLARPGRSLVRPLRTSMMTGRCAISSV